jgi:hypothetical protein
MPALDFALNGVLLQLRSRLAVVGGRPDRAARAHPERLLRPATHHVSFHARRERSRAR